METMVISIRNKAGVHCREVVRFSEGPLWEVRLYRKFDVKMFFSFPNAFTTSITIF